MTSSSPSKAIKTCQLLSKFMISQGLPYHAIRSTSFRDLLKHFEPKTDPPTEKELEDCLKGAEPPQVMDCGGTATISITVDVAEESGDQRFLVFSIHHFQDSYERTTVVYFEKLEIAQFQWTTLWSLITSAFSTYTNFSIINVVCSTPELSQLFRPSEASDDVTTTRHDVICFYHYVSEFATTILNLEEIKKGAKKFENFLQILKTNFEVYQCFMELQKSKSLDSILPPSQRECWQEELFFLTRCLEMDSTFRELNATWSLNPSDDDDAYISTTEFNHLFHVQQILEECQQCLQVLTFPDTSTLSQVIPAVARIRKCLVDYSMDSDDVLKSKLEKAFEETVARVAENRRHRFATWLDPRHASSRNVFSEQSLEEIGAEILEEFLALRATSSSEKEEESGVSLSIEIRSYLKLLNEKPPDDTVRPFFWWLFHQERLPMLANMAKAFLTCPAVAIDARYFFGSAKFSQMVRAYSRSSALDWLKFAGSQQEFRGRGAGMEYRRNERFARPELRFKLKSSSLTTEPLEHSRPGKRKLEETSSSKVVRRVGDYFNAKKQRPPVQWSYNPAATIKEALERGSSVSEPALNGEMMMSSVLNEVKTEPMETMFGSVGGGEMEDESEDPMDAEMNQFLGVEGTGPRGGRKRNQCKRSCVLCHRLRPHTDVKNVTIAGEKLLMTMAAMMAGDVTYNHAQSVYHRQKKSFFCREHYGEAAREMLKATGVKGGVDGLRKCSMERLQPKDITNTSENQSDDEEDNN